MYKLAVFDLDGTLLNSKHRVSKENLEAINILRKNNIKVTIATGRSNELLKPYVKALSITDDIITCNGTVIGHPSKDKMLYEDFVPKSEVRKALSMCNEYNHEFLVYTSKAILTRQNDWNNFLDEKNVKSNDDFNVNFTIINDVEKIINDYNVNKVLIIERDPNKYKELIKRASIFTNVSHTQSARSYLDIGPLNNSKGNAVKILCKELGIKLKDVIAFGDQMNDISMISIVGLGIAMGNAKEEVKNSADYVTLSNDENGVAYAIQNQVINLKK